MKVMHGRKIKDFKEAANLAFSETRMEGMQPYVADLFKPVVDITKLNSEAEKNINSAICGRYRRNPTWDGMRWYIPVPEPGYDSRGIPKLTIELKIYLVTSGEVQTDDSNYQAALFGQVGKPESLIIPLVILQAILDDDLSQFAILARNAGRTTWDIPGFKSVNLPDELFSRVSDTLRRKSVVSWLIDFGPQGRGIAPLVAGTMLGMQFTSATAIPPVSKQRWTYEGLIEALKAMAYTVSEAKEMVDRALPYIRAYMTLEEAVRFVLQYSVNGGQR